MLCVHACMFRCQHHLGYGIFFSDFGFNQVLFLGSERRENYRVQIKFFSGGIHHGFILLPSLELSGTASKYDNST